MVLLTDTGVPSEHISVKDVERQMSKTARDFAIEVFAVERAVMNKEKRSP